VNSQQQCKAQKAVHNGIISVSRNNSTVSLGDENRGRWFWKPSGLPTAGSAEINELSHGQECSVNPKAYSAIEAEFRELGVDELDGCNRCLHKCSYTSCKIVDSVLTRTTTCKFQKSNSTSTTENNIHDIEDLLKCSGGVRNKLSHREKNIY
jgi:hypothetical protein